MIEIPAGWNIVYEAKPISIRTIDWDFWHDDQDEGDIDLGGTASSFEDAIKQIKEIEKCHGLGEG